MKKIIDNYNLTSYDYSNEFIPQKFFYKDAQLERTVVGIEKKNKDLLNSMNLV